MGTIDRIYEIIDFKGVSANEFSNKIGVSNGYLAKQKAKNGNVGSQIIEKIVIDNPDINLEWLMTGRGEMLRSSKPKEQTPSDGEPVVKVKPTQHPAGIPLIPIDAMAGFAQGEQQVLELDCEHYVVPMFRGAEFLIPVKGSSMSPKYHSGDIVACKHLPMSDIFFQWNKVYVLDTDQGALIKRVKKGSDVDYVLIISENEKYEPFELHLSQIRSVAIVLGVIRLE